MKKMWKGILSLFVGIAIISCAGTDSSAQKKGHDNSNLVKAGTPAADSLVSGMTEFARSIFKGTFDSIPGDYYYHVTDGRIDSLFKKEGGQYKPIISIDYDFIVGQSGFELKKNNYSYFIKEGVLTQEVDFPKYSKAYWSNGKTKAIMTGLLYRDDQGVFQVDSGLSEIYFENGKIKEQNDWKDKQLIVSKVWNENGILITELDFPKYVKAYWDNGKPKAVMTGVLYRSNQSNIAMDSGHSEIYFENGKINQQNDWKGKKLIAQKEWNEKGTLTKEFEFPKYYKEYCDDGKPKIVSTGLLYKDDQGNFSVDSGHSEIYFENGKIKEQNEWKDKQVVANKTWNENGVLTLDIDFPKYAKMYWDNGKPKEVLTGLLYKNDRGSIRADSGHSEIYFENGQIKEQNDWKDKQIIASKLWNENGVLITDFISYKYAKIYWDNGNLKGVITGSLYVDDRGNFVVDSGHTESYFENGKIREQIDWKDKQVVANKTWNENGVLTLDIDFPKYAKMYWDNGKPKEVLTGLLYKNDQGFIRVDSGHSEIYFENGKFNEKNEWKDKLLIASKVWNENGILIKELDFPKYARMYWDNGKPKEVLSGLLYKNDRGNFELDSGHSEIYFENGKIKEQNDWKNKQPVASKQWNENGVLIKELDFPKSIKTYWNNGKPKSVAIGLLYKDDQGDIRVDSGRSDIYFENGKIKEQNDWKDKQFVAQKIWNERGVITFDLNFPKYVKEYWDNGKPKSVAIGLLYRVDQGPIKVDSGHSEIYFENGKIKQQCDWKNKQPIANKQWNENGVLLVELNFPKSFKAYWDNGKPKAILTGVLYRDNQGNIEVDSGHSEIYFENGQIKEQNDWKNKQIVTNKTWNENGVLTVDIDFPKHIKGYWDNGKLKGIMTGLLYRDDQGNFHLDSGHSEAYFENGQIKEQNDWKDKQIVANKTWNEKGVLTVDINLPKYSKWYWDDGRLEQIATGVLYRDDQGVIRVDSGRSEVYFENGKIKEQNDWKDKQPTVSKRWNENGILTVDFIFPKYYELYWDNGNIKEIATGLLYRDDKGNFEVDSGHTETYFENGGIQRISVCNNKQLIAYKQWNENGTVKKEGVVAKGFHKEYFPNGKISVDISGKFHYDDNWGIILENAIDKQWNENGILTDEILFPKYAKFYSDSGALDSELEGTLYYDEEKEIQVQDGTKKWYRDNGKLWSLRIYKEKKLVSKKKWYKNGNLDEEGDASKGFYRSYHSDGKLYMNVLGKFHYNNKGFFENIILENATQKWWGTNGNLKKEIVFPKYVKEYSDNGTLVKELEGTLYYDDQDEIQVQDGFKKEYSDKGKLTVQKNYKGKKLVRKTVWRENGNIFISAELPDRYREFYNDGKIRTEVIGVIVEEDDSFRIKDGTYKEYDFNGKVTYTATYEDFQRISEK